MRKESQDFDPLQVAKTFIFIKIPVYILLKFKYNFLPVYLLPTVAISIINI